MAQATAPIAIAAARKIQIGIETTPGTAVNATRRILTKGASYDMIEETEPFEGQMHGTLARVVDSPRSTRRGTVFTFDGDLDFSQILLPLTAGMKGGVTAATPGAADARTWTFDPSPTADPQPDTYTIEWAERNLDASPDEWEFESLYCFCTSMEISGGAEASIPQLSFTMEGRRAKTGTATAAIAIPDIRPAIDGRWYFYLNDTWAALGDTALLGAVYGFTWRFETGLRAGYFLDGRADLDFSTYLYGPRWADLTMDLVIDPTASSVVRDEIADKGDYNDDGKGSERYIRFRNYGENFTGGDSGLYREVRVDGKYYHASDSMVRLGEDRDGNPIIRWHLMSGLDTGESKDIEVFVQNNVATWPG